MFLYAKQAWNIVDNNEPQISNYFPKELFKILAILFPTTIFLVLFQLPAIIAFSITGCWIMLRIPYILAEALNLMHRNFVSMDAKKLKLLFINKRLRFYVFSLLFLAAITPLIMTDHRLFLIKFSCIDCFMRIILSFILLNFYLSISALYLFSKNSLWQSISKNRRMISYIPNFLKIVLLDLIPGYSYLLIREVFRRLKSPMTIFSYNGFLRFSPFILASISIFCKEFFCLDDIIDFETVQSFPKMEEIDPAKLHLSVEASASNQY